MERHGVLAVAFLGVVLVACGGHESTTLTSAADVLSADSSIPTPDQSEDDGDLVRVIGRVPALAGFEISESGRPDGALIDGEADLRWRYARLAISECEELQVHTQLSRLSTWYEAPGVHQTRYGSGGPYAALLIRDRLVILHLRPICHGDIQWSSTSDELMVLAESIAAEYWIEP